MCIVLSWVTEHSLHGLPVLEVLNATKASEGTIDHDGKSSTESFTLFHAI